MALVPVAARNRINPLSVSTIEQTGVPYVTYDEVETCTDPNCPVCRGQRYGRHHKHHHHKRHHHHHRKHKSYFWDSFFSRDGSAKSIISTHNIELDERRPYYSSHVTERAVVPVNQTERQVVSTTTTRRIEDDDIVREAWVSNHYFQSRIIE
jgi:hypothetical protein